MSGQTAVSISERQSFLPVTALEFCSFSGSVYLLAGEGPYLKVFSTYRGLLAKAKILPFSRIHGIRPSTSSKHPNHPQNSGGGIEGSRSILIFGQKRLKFVRLIPPADAGSSFRIECGPAPPLCLDDWILDACWLECSGSSGSGSSSVAAVTAHNAVHIIQSSSRSGETRIIANYYCELNCILYSARLETSSGSDLTVLSGTVFNDILLWRVVTDGRDDVVMTSSAGAHSSETERQRVCLTLSGHEGVIFSVRIGECGSRLVSVSDDRTVRVWDLPTDWKSMERGEMKSCSLVLHGHTARVWGGRCLRDGGVISIGEDATCRVWDGQGRCVKVVEGHRGRSIWSMAVDEHSGIVATGGGDCSIRLFGLETHSNDCSWSVDTTLPATEPAVEETPRLVELRGRTVLCLSSTGSLYAADFPFRATFPGTVWRLIHGDSQFSGYAAMALSPDSQWVALGSLRGCVALLHLGKSGQQPETLGVKHLLQWSAHQGKVFSLTWLDSFKGYSNTLLSCGPTGEMVVWGVPEASDLASEVAIPLTHLRLPLSKHRWVTAAVIISSPESLSPQTSADSGISAANDDRSCCLQTESCLLVCGDRKGSLHVFQTSPSKEWLEPLQSLRGVHGANGVTHISLWRGFITSCGRDGHSRTFSLHPHTGSLTELSSYRPVKGMDWVERQFNSECHHLVLGFHSTDMVLYSVMENRQLVSVSCGGGHRSYGCTPLSQLLQTKEAVVVFIKKLVVSIRVVDLTLQLTAPVLQKGFVGREAVTLQMVHSDPVTGCGLVAVGSEDCSLCLLSLQPSSDGDSLDVSERRFLQGHISTVRALSTSPSGQRSHTLLFSGGGRASLKVWKIRVGEVSGGDEPEVHLEAELSIHDDMDSHQRRKGKRRRRGRGPGAESLVPESRIMALTSLPLSPVVDGAPGRHYVAAGCSDGIIRHYIYNEETRSFSSLGDLEYHNRCILTVSHLVLPTHRLAATESTLCLLSAATDGRVAVWTQLVPEDSSSGPTSSASHSVESEETVEKCIQPLTVCQAHQSGVNDLSIRKVSDGFYLIATVGDDNALAILGLSVSGDSLHSVRLELFAIESTAHASSITGVSFLGNGLVVTSSIDQRLCVWGVGLHSSAGFTGKEIISHQVVRGKECDRSDLQNATLSLVHSQTHDIADASSLTLYRWREGRHIVVVCGIGLQCFVIRTQPS